ncbi:hypothetical protein GCM10027614_14400 [Micromonospora vulcania]
MSAGERGRLGRFTDAVLGGARVARDKARELRDEFRTSDEPERALVAPLVAGQELRYVGLAPVRTPRRTRPAGSSPTGWPTSWPTRSTPRCCSGCSTSSTRWSGSTR